MRTTCSLTASSLLGFFLAEGERLGVEVFGVLLGAEGSAVFLAVPVLVFIEAASFCERAGFFEAGLLVGCGDAPVAGCSSNSAS